MLLQYLGVSTRIVWDRGFDGNMTAIFVIGQRLTQYGLPKSGLPMHKTAALVTGVGGGGIEEGVNLSLFVFVSRFICG